MADAVKTEKAAIPELSVDTLTLMALLRKAEEGDVVTYEALSASIRRNVQVERHLLASARHRVLYDNRMVFGAVMGVGLKRLGPAGIVSTGESAIRHIRRTSKRAAKKQSVVSLDDLSDAEKSRSLAYQGMFGVLGHMTKERVMKKVAESSTVAALPTATMLDEIRGTL